MGDFLRRALHTCLSPVCFVGEILQTVVETGEAELW